MKLSLRKWTSRAFDRADVERQAAEELDRQVGRGMPAPEEWKELDARLASLDEPAAGLPESEAPAAESPSPEAEPVVEAVVATAPAERPAASGSRKPAAKPAASRSRKPAAKPASKPAASRSRKPAAKPAAGR